MPVNEVRPHRRKSIRLRGYDYSQPGAYFVTICLQGMPDLLSEIVEGEIKLNAFGAIVQSCWDDLPKHYAHIALDSFVVMPNHVHGIIVIHDDTVGAGSKPALGLGSGFEPAKDVGAGFEPAPTKRVPLSEIVRGFKTFSARRINELRRTPGVSVWQRNYYERIIRDDCELEKIRQYISTNPLRAETGWENILGIGQ